MSGLTSEEREVELRWDERDQLARAQHATWHIGCTHECGGRLGDSIKSDEWIAPVVEDILKRRMAPLAARLADAEARAEAAEATRAAAEKAVEVYFEWRRNLHSIEAHQYGGYKVRDSERRTRQAMDDLRQAHRGDS